jgi:hypothetical protein
MLRFHELQQNPVDVSCRDENGDTINVTAIRLREGLVRMTCQCQHYAREGWCKHCLAVFTDPSVFKDVKHREAFEQLVGATYLQEAAAKLINALDAFATAYRQMESSRPSQIDGGQLKKFALDAGRAASSADDVADALEGFVNEAKAVRDFGGRPVPASSSLSKEKLGALDMVRRVLAKK